MTFEHGQKQDYDPRIRILVRLIEESQGTLRLTAIEIGSLFGLGEARLLRLFKQQVGKPLRRYLLEVRMTRAAELLAYGVIPIKTIAVESGYAQLTSFYRDFKRIHGISPLKMRLLHLELRLRDKHLPGSHLTDSRPFGGNAQDRQSALPALTLE